MGLLTGLVFGAVRIGLAMSPHTQMKLHPKAVPALAAFGVAVIYLFVSGMSVATQRAFVMVAVMLLAVCLNRRAITLRSVAIAALIILIISPDALTGPGFQMSFAATVGLVACFAILRDTEFRAYTPRWGRPILALLISSGVAGLATAPFAAAHFNQVVHYGLIANLLSVPVMGMVIMPAAIFAALLSPLGLEWIGLWIMEQGIAWIIAVALEVSSWSGAVTHVPAPPNIFLPTAALSGALLCLWQGRGRLLGVFGLCLGLMLWTTEERPYLLISESGQLMGLKTASGRALSKSRGDGFAARVWIENDGDVLEQVQAAELWNFSPVPGKDFEIPDLNLRFSANKNISAQEVTKLCSEYQIVVLPRVRTDGACQVLDQAYFRREGAVAITLTANGIEITTARSVRGSRPWVPKTEFGSRVQ